MRSFDPAAAFRRSQTAGLLSRAWLGLALIFLTWLATLLPVAVRAQELGGSPKYAAIVVDAVSGEVLYANRADSIRYPASLTKIMTLYMAFEALSRGTLKPDDRITLTAHAVSQPAVKMYMREGDTIDVDTCMKLIALYSANDLAVALGEHIAGSEERFSALMTVRAHDLGMSQTNFVNASGLPDARQTTSARDMAVLARAVMRDYPQYYGYFNVRSLAYRGRTYTNHNPLLNMPGVDGMKTGYVNASGYNLVASQMKDGHRLIAVMLGGSSKDQRRAHVTSLMNVGFDVLGRRESGETILVAQAEFSRGLNAPLMAPSQAVPYTQYASNDRPLTDSELRAALDGSEIAGATPVEVHRVSSTVNAPDVVQAVSPPSPAAAAAARAIVPPSTTPHASTPVANPAPARTTPPARAAAAPRKNPTAVWSIQVGAFKDKALADRWVTDVRRRFGSNLTGTSASITRNSQGWYRTRFADLTQEAAQAACRAMTAKSLDCMVIKPGA